jgi:hypothetical protein
MKKSLLCAALFTSMLSFGASAELIHSDWKAAGDGLTTIDTSTGLEFLKLNQTVNKSYNQVYLQLSSMYLGWRPATKLEVGTYIDHIFGLAHSSYDERNVYWGNGNISKQHDLLGYKIISANTISYGVVYGGGTYGSLYGAYTPNNATFRVFLGYENQYKDDVADARIGTYLVRDAVASKVENIEEVADVSTPFALSSLALLGFGAIRRPKSTNKDVVS